MAAALASFEPRKTPIQARATVPVEAFSEPILQILLSQGERLTTSRVAGRAFRIGMAVRPKCRLHCGVTSAERYKEQRDEPTHFRGKWPGCHQILQPATLPIRR